MRFSWSTLLLQLVNFLVLLWVLRRFLFAPVRRVLEDRRRRTDAAAAAVQAAEARVRETERTLAARLADLEAERDTIRREAHVEIEQERARVLEAARAEAARMAEAERAELAVEQRRALAELKGEVADLAASLAGAILERVAPTALDEGLLDAALAHLRGLSEAERRRLADELAGEGARLTVATSHPLPDNMAARWRRDLVAALGGASDLGFVHDPTLGAGLELRFPTARLSFALSSLLDRAKAQLARDVRAA